MKQYRYTINGHAYEVTIHSADEETAEVEVNGRSYTVCLGEQSATPAAPVKAPAPKAPAAKPAPAPAPKPEPAPVPEAKAEPASAKKSAGAGKQVIAPLPGLIRDVLVKEGDAVKKGQKIMVLEAMKMENEINADCDGTITSLLVEKGDSVQGGDPLATIG